jgi:UDP-GlcNAc:undecaprenyl-phosphate GlcNAc-1-phosphate transferase
MEAVGAFVSFVVTIVFMFALRPVAVETGLVDLPGGRKRHGAVVPLIGGLAMSVGLGFGTSIVEHPEFWNPTILSIYLLIAVGTIDDRFDLPPGVRLIAQTCASLLVVFASDITVTHLGSAFFFDVPLGPFSSLFSILFILAIINAFNMIDGIDGLAGSIALVSLAAIAVIGVTTPIFGLTLILLAVVAAFLLFNFPVAFNRPVRAFMGDAGSTAIGLSIACIGIALSQGDAPRIPPVIGLWLVAVPVYDLYSSITRRIMERKSPFAPDHEHLHHVLMESGLSARKTLAFMVVLAVIFAAFGVIGDMLALPEGVMCLLWLAGGVLYYQMLRRPKAVVHLVALFETRAKRVRPESA